MFRSSPVVAVALLMSAWSGSIVAQAPSASPVQTVDRVSAAVQEKDLDAPGTIALVRGESFRIAVPLRLEAALNLGAAKLDITLTRKVKAKHAEEDLHLVAVLGAAQASLDAKDKSVLLHGVVPEFAADRAGYYHPSDYSIHLGSGNVTNLGTPDEKFIDTEALTNKLQELKLHLSAAPGK